MREARYVFLEQREESADSSRTTAAPRGRIEDYEDTALIAVHGVLYGFEGSEDLHALLHPLLPKGHLRDFVYGQPRRHLVGMDHE